MAATQNPKHDECVPLEAVIQHDIDRLQHDALEIQVALNKVTNGIRHLEDACKELLRERTEG